MAIVTGVTPCVLSLAIIVLSAIGAMLSHSPWRLVAMSVLGFVTAMAAAMLGLFLTGAY